MKGSYDMSEREPRSNEAMCTASRLVTARSARYLRLTTASLAATLALLVGMLVLLQLQYIELGRNFTDNRNVHIIEVDFRTGTGSGELRFSDIEVIGSAARAGSAGPVSVVPRYHLPFGLPDSSGTTYVINGLGGEAAPLLGLGTWGPDAAAGIESRTGLAVEVPVVSVQPNGGMVSEASESIVIDVTAIRADAPLTLFDRLMSGAPGDESPTLLVGEHRFANIIEIVTGMSWKEFQEDHDSTQGSLGFEAVSAVYVDVANLGDVDAVGRALADAGFATSYTLRAFDDLAGTLSTGTAAGLVALVLLIVLCFTVTFTSFRSYLTLAHRDMGILKHVGYGNTQLLQMYSRRLTTVSVFAALPAVGLVTLTTATILRGSFAYGLLNGAIVLTLLLAVHVAVTRAVLPRHIRLPVLTLLKLDRQFE